MRHARRPRDPPIALSEENGVRYLHFGSEWVQGAMRLRAPDRLALEYLQRMMAWLLFLEAPRHILHIGVGAGSLIRFCLRRLPATQLTGIESSPRVLAVAHQHFRLPPADPRVRLIVDDGARHVARRAHRGRYGVITVDAFDAAARGPVLDSTAFYASCRGALGEAGILVVNLFGEHPSLARNRARLRQVFDGRVLELTAAGEENAIALAFSGPPLSVDWRALRARAARVSRDYGLPARDWVAKLAAAAPGSAGFAI